MTVNQIATILNTIATETSTETALVNEDLSNIVEYGTTIFSSNWKDNFVKSLIDQIGKMVFVDRPYNGFAPSIIRSSWDYGSILAKVRAKDFEAVDNPSWALTPGTTVDQFEFNPPDVSQTFWNDRSAWQIECSYAEMQVRSAMKSPGQANAFFSMIESTVDRSRTKKINDLVMRALNNFSGEKIHAANGVVNVLTMYNTVYGTSLTADKAHTDDKFLRYLAYTILDLKDQLKVSSSVFNMGGAGYLRDTPGDRLHVVLNSIYGRALDVFMQADTYHNDLTEIGSYETVPFWQGNGAARTVADRTSIDIKIASDNSVTVQQGYIVGMMFDEDAIALNNENMRVTSAYNANGEYFNNFYKVETSLMNDTTENGIILVLA